jgi:hypothetical protein
LEEVFWAITIYDTQTRSQLQTVPCKSWLIALRMYGPEQAWIDQTWRPGEIELVK